MKFSIILMLTAFFRHHTHEPQCSIAAIAAAYVVDSIMMTHQPRTVTRNSSSKQQRPNRCGQHHDAAASIMMLRQPRYPKQRPPYSTLPSICARAVTNTPKQQPQQHPDAAHVPAPDTSPSTLPSRTVTSTSTEQHPKTAPAPVPQSACPPAPSSRSCKTIPLLQ